MNELISQLGIDWRMLLAQLFNFILLLIVLERFVYRPVIKVVDERKAQIEENNTREARLELKLAEIDSIQKNLLVEARKEADKIRAESLERSEEARSHILAEAEKTAEAMIELERNRFASEIERLEESIQSQVAALLMSSIEKSLGNVLDEGAQKKLLARSIEEFKSEYTTKDFRGTIQLKPRS
ncbi:MAG: hypothetical protein WDZ74_01085 [Candidatus Paceibacterota bacterium]